MEPKVYAGIDVSKESLDVDWGTQRKTYENAARGITRLVPRLKKAGVVLVVVEATGGFEQSCVEALWASEIAVAVVNPRQTSAFARSLGVTAKTDRIDAGVLRLFAERMQPPARPPLPERVQTLKRLLERRAQLMDMLVAEKNRSAAPLSCPCTKRSISRMLKVLKKELKVVEAEAAAIIERNQDLSLIAQKVQTEKGVGPVLTLALLADMPELGTLNRRQVAALAGVAPFDKQSGNFDGIRSIAGGRPRLRHTLYMATVCAIRRNTTLKEFFLSLVKRGKKKIVALVATMRKFIIRLNSLVRKLRQENTAIAFAYT